MRIIFTRNSTLLSKIIRAGLKEPVSHVAIVFDDKIVFHSNLKGTHIEWFNEFKKKSDVVYTLSYDLSLEEEEAIYQSVIDKNISKPYDFSAFLFFAYRAFMHKVFGTDYPITNPANKSWAWICVEAVGSLPEKFQPKTPIDLSMTSPYSLYILLGGAGAA